MGLRCCTVALRGLGGTVRVACSRVLKRICLISNDYKFILTVREALHTYHITTTSDNNNCRSGDIRRVVKYTPDPY